MKGSELRKSNRDVTIKMIAMISKISVGREDKSNTHKYLQWENRQSYGIYIITITFLH